MIVFALAALAALAASRIRARRVGGIVFIKAGSVNMSYSRSKRRAPSPAPASLIDDERLGYSARAYVSR